MNTIEKFSKKLGIEPQDFTAKKADALTTMARGLAEATTIKQMREAAQKFLRETE